MTEGTVKTILLVEDEALIALAEKKMLENHGYRVILAASGEKSIEMFKATPETDLVLMDINLGRGMDGTIAAAKIQELRDVPLVFLSSHTERDIVEKTEGITSYGYIVKNSGEIVLLASIKMAFKLFESKVREQAKTEALRASEEKYRHLIENSHDIIYTMTPGGVFTFVSNAWTSLLGHPVGDVLGTTFELFVHPDDVPVCRAWMRSVIEAGRRRDCIEYRVRHADGSWRWHTSSAVPLRDESGAITGFEGIASDMTGRRQAEEAFRESERNLKTMFDAIDQSLFFIEQDGTILAANKTFAERLGKTPAECVGRSAFDLIPHELVAGRRANMECVFETGEPVCFDDERQGRYIHQSLYPVKDEAGRTVRLVVYAIDDTDRRRVLESLRIRETLYRTLFEVSPMGLTISDEHGRILETNNKAESLLGVSSDEHVMRRIDDSEWRIFRRDGTKMPPDEFASTRALAERRLVEKVEMGVDAPDGSVRWLNVAAAPVPLDGYGVVIAYNDITERVVAEDRVAALLREKDLILKEAHHRIKNNMGTVSGLLSLQAAACESSACRDILEEAATRVQGMMLLYDRLYHAGGQDRLSVGEFLPPLVQQIAGIFAKASRVRIEVEAEDFDMCARSLSAVGIIINELITNSVKYAFMAEDEGLIRVTAARSGSTATIVYEDNGPGLPDGVDFENSAGFGMQLVGMLAQQAGGTIRMERGGGARFVLELAV